ncbi:hypothetical protein BGZ49_009058 [Haplosporangium sp. Z 27]|nr:hypothetical protein BGZ49_009058 [Haplosporangium sp. Z 27]
MTDGDVSLKDDGLWSGTLNTDQQSTQASVKPSDNEITVSNYHNNVEKAIETLSVNQVNMATDEENTTTLVSGVEHSITFIEHEDAFRPTNGMRVDDYEPQSSQTLPFETLGIGTESPTIHIQCKPKFDDITTGNTPTFTEQISPEKKKTLTNIPPHLEAQPINNPNNNDETSLLSFTGVSDQGSILTTLEIDTQAQQRIKIQETSCISKTENRSAESSEQQELHQHATPSQERRYEEEVQQSINNNRDNCYDQDRNLVDVASIKRQNPSDRRPEDEDDEGGERGTVIILKTSYHRSFGLAKNSSTTINNTFSDAYKPNQSQSGSHEVVPADSLVEIAENINPLITKSNPVGNTNDNVDCHDNHKRIQFTLEPSGLDFDESTLHRSGSISPAPYFSQSSSAPSASSSSAPSPISARQTQQRPYSQLQPRSIFKDNPGDQSISLSSQSQKDEFLQGQFQQIQQHLRRSRSLPSTTCSSESSRHEAQQQQRQQQLQQQLASEAHLWLTSCMSESKRSTIVKDQALEGEHDIESNGSIRVKSIRNSQQNFQLLSSPIQKDDTITEESSVSPLVTSMQTSGLQMRSPSSERPRRQSLLSPRQFEMMNQQQHQQEQQPQHQNLLSSSLSSAFGKKGGFSSFLKDHTGRSKNKSNTADSRVVSNSSDNSQKQRQKQKQKQKKKKKKQERPTASNTPTISFQPHSTEISTDRPSVSGRLVLHIPQLPGLKFHFVSLALHLRLKESISWVRKDIVSFETEKHHWSQIVWDKKMMLPFQDRQVEEGTEAGFTTSAGKNLSAAAAVAAAVSASSASASANEPTQQHSSQRDLNLNIPTTSTATLARGSHQQSNISTKSDHNDYTPTMDEWRWEWLLPVSRSEVRPESFEGSLGMVWYELEAKCLFRWDKVNEDGHVTQSNDLQSSTSHAYLDGGANRSNKLLKGLGASTNKSIAQVFGKLRAGNKSKKARVHAGHAGHAGDFKLNTKHNEFIKSSHSKSKEALENETKEQTTTGEVTDDPDATATAPTNPCNVTDTDNEPTQDLNSISQPQSSTKLVPFLIRKTLKLYFNKSPPRESSNPAFFLPQPSMSLPNLPSTRRLKAIIPGAKVQVLIQVPSMVSIPSYSQTSRLTPCSKTGGLVEVKKGSKASGDSGHRGDKTVYNLVGKKIKGKRTAPIQQQQLNKDRRLPNSFQAALTIRKVTRQDIKDDSFLRRRYENAQLAADAISNSLAQHHQTSGTSPKPAPRKRMLSHTSGTGSQAGGSAGEQSDTSSVFNNSAVEAGLQGHNRAWRKEIQVRNVKCEFWQKETCRIPLEDVPIRSIRVPIGDTFTYSEMEQEKERQRQGNNQKSFHQHVGSSIDTNNLTTSNMAPFRKEISSRSSSPAPPACGDNSLPLRSSPRFGGGVAWKESLGSVKPQQQHGLAPTQTSSNQPFTLLIPVHLDSKKLRQTFVWPSSETPSPIAPPGYDHSAARGSNGTFGLDSSVLGYGSELDYRSQFSMNEMGSFIGNGVETTRGTDGGVGGAHGNNNNDNNINNNNGQVNTPPVAARIEVEHYLAIRLSIDVLEFEGECEHDDDDLDMAMGGNNEHCNNCDDNTLLMIAPRLPFAPASNVSLTAQTIGNSMPPPPLSNTLSPTAIEPALNFLTSAAGLLNMDTVGEPGPVSVGTTYDLSKRRGSKSSNNETGSSSQQTLNVSSSVGGNGSSSGGGLISSTLGALKKKASVTALSNNNRRQVNVQRLKDYVIRVPITVVVQVDERGKQESAYRRMSGSENNRTDVTQTTGFDENSRRNVTTTATTTTTNIVTGSSRPIRVSVEGTETFSSLNSLAASADSESVKKRMMDDFADTSSSALMFAGIKNRQGASLGLVNSHQNALQYLQGLRHHSSRKQGVFGNSDISSSLVKGDGDARQEIHDDEDEEGDFVVVDAQEIAEDYIEEDS